VTRVLDDNPVYRRDLRTWVTGRKVVRVIWAVVLAGGLLALSVAKFGYPEFAIYTFPSLWILLWLLGWFFVSWAPPALTGGVFATEAERGTLTGLVLSPFPVRKLIWGYLVSRTRTLLAGFVLFVLLLTLSPLAFVDTLEGGAAKLMGLLNPFPVRTAAAPQGAGSVLSEVPAPPEDVDVRGHLWATLPWIGAGSLVVGIKGADGKIRYGRATSFGAPLYEPVFDPLRPIASENPLDPRAEFEELADAHLRVERIGFGEVSHSAAHIERLLEAVESGDASASVRRGQITGEDPHGRGLARPVRTEKADDLPLPDVEGDMIQRRNPRERLGKIARFNHIDNRTNRKSGVSPWGERMSREPGTKPAPLESCFSTLPPTWSGTPRR